MKLAEYNALLWQDQQEAYFDFCEANQLDHTDPDSQEDFLNSLKEAAE